MMYVLYGEDTYRSRRKLNEIVAAYREKAGAAESVHRWDAETDDVAAFKRVAETGSLFGGKRLVVIENLLASKLELEPFADVFALARDGSAGVFFILRDGALGVDAEKRRKKIERYCSKTQEFRALAGSALVRWIREEAARRGVRLSAADEARYVSFGGDLWATANELERHAVSSGGAPAAHLAGREATIFEAGDSFLTAPGSAARSLLKLFSQGQDELGVFSYLANHCRTVLVAGACMARSRAIPKEHNIHPFVAEKASRLARRVPPAQLANAMDRFFESDRRIKTGRLGAKEALILMALTVNEKIEPRK